VKPPPHPDRLPAREERECGLCSVHPYTRVHATARGGRARSGVAHPLRLRRLEHLRDEVGADPVAEFVVDRRHHGMESGEVGGVDLHAS
jgi:hypothetical protein